MSSSISSSLPSLPLPALPSIVSVKTMEKEVDLLLAQYKIVHANYLRDVQNGDKINSTKNLFLMNELNNLILMFFSKIETDLNIINQKTKTYSKQTKEFNKILIKLRKNEKNLDEMTTGKDLDGKFETGQTQTISEYYHYTFYFILAVIVGFTIFKVVNTTESNLSETIILITGMVVLIYHLRFFFMNFIASLMVYVGKFGNAINEIIN